MIKCRLRILRNILKVSQCLFFRLLPKSEMRTRGNKLPEFSLHFKMRHSKREPVASSAKKANDKQCELLSSILRPVANLSKPGQSNSKKGGRTRLELILAFKLSDFPPQFDESNRNEDSFKRLSEKETKSIYDSSENSDFEVT